MGKRLNKLYFLRVDKYGVLTKGVSIITKETPKMYFVDPPLLNVSQFLKGDMRIGTDFYALADVCKVIISKYIKNDKDRVSSLLAAKREMDIMAPPRFRRPTKKK